MNRYIIGSLWDRVNRNGANKNFEYLFKGVARMNQLNVRADNTLEEAERINKENTSVQRQIDDLILSDGESDAEVIQARGQYPLLKDRLDMSEYQTQELVQNMESDLNEELNNIVRHRPIRVGESAPSNSVGNDGDLYIQTYDDNELEFYETGSFTPYITASGNAPSGIEYSERTGYYTRIGNLVTVVVKIDLTSKGTGGSGNLRVYGIPYSGKYEQYIPISGEVSGFNAGTTGTRIFSSALIGQNGGNFLPRYYLGSGIIDPQWLNYSYIEDNFMLATTFSYIASESSTGLF